MVMTGSTWMPGASPDSIASPVSQKPELIQLCTALALPEWMDTITSGYSVLKAATMRAQPAGQARHGRHAQAAGAERADAGGGGLQAGQSDEGFSTS